MHSLLLAFLLLTQHGNKSHGHGNGGGVPPPVSCAYPSYCVQFARDTFSGVLPLTFSFTSSTTSDCSLDPNCNPVQDVISEQALALTEGDSLSLGYDIRASGASFGWWQSGFGNIPGGGCVNPANFSMFFSSANGDKWWAWPGYVALPDGTYELAGTLSVALLPVNWINQNGSRGDSVPSVFASDIASIRWHGLSFGGGCFADKGVFLTSGSATMTVD